MFKRGWNDNPDANADSRLESDTDTHPCLDADPNTDTCLDTYSNTYALVDSDADTHAFLNAYPEHTDECGVSIKRGNCFGFFAIFRQLCGKSCN